MVMMESERIRIGALEVVFYANRTHTAGHADVYEVVIPEGARVPAPHHHVDVDEVVTCLEGVITYRVGDDVVEVRPGQVAFSPRGLPHHFENKHAGRARMLITATPARMGPEYFREMSALVGAGGPPDPAKMKTVMAKYGLEMVTLPPL